jgi:hypothetical protein
MTSKVESVEAAFPNWQQIRCSYCVCGVTGYEAPEECDACGGTGSIWVSPHGRLADYPGGPFRGSLSKRDHQHPEHPEYVR